jgi:hypothetical protein
MLTSWWDLTLREVRQKLASPWTVSDHLKEIEAKMALDAAALKAQINDATNNLAGDVAGLKAKLEAALVERQVAIEGAVQEALAGLDTLANNLTDLAASTPEDEAPVEPTP